MPKKGSNPVGRPRKYKTPKEMQERIEAYFAKCDARMVKMVINQGNKKGLVDVPKPEPYTVQGLAVFLDLTTEGLLEYEAREEFSATIKIAKAEIEADKVVHMLDGDGATVGYIFDLKNNHGWKDKQEIEHSGGIGVHFDREDENL
jgi:hypothetical protein